MNKSIVVLSGGQDSVTCFGVAKRETELVGAISFHYNQRHAVELDYAKQLSADHGVPHRTVDLGFIGQLVTSALTGPGDLSAKHGRLTDLPASFVPSRNALFLTVAHALAQEIEASVIYTGVCQTDYSGYPDCREEFIQSLQHSLNLGYQTNIEIKTPLMRPATTGGMDVGFVPPVCFVPKAGQNTKPMLPRRGPFNDPDHQQKLPGLTFRPSPT